MNAIEPTTKPTEPECYFSKFRENTVGINHTFESVYGEQNLVYADWVASGRLYNPIEDIMLHKIGPMIAPIRPIADDHPIPVERTASG